MLFYAWLCAASLQHCAALNARREFFSRRHSVALNLGSIALVGAGPGDPELLTIAALRSVVETARDLVSTHTSNGRTLYLTETYAFLCFACLCDLSFSSNGL